MYLQFSGIKVQSPRYQEVFADYFLRCLSNILYIYFKNKYAYQEEVVHVNCITCNVYHFIMLWN